MEAGRQRGIYFSHPVCIGYNNYDMREKKSKPKVTAYATFNCKAIDRRTKYRPIMVIMTRETALMTQKTTNYIQESGLSNVGLMTIDK